MLNTKLLETIQSKQAIIGIVGLGYVGLPLMLRFVESGFNVLGFDIDTKKIEQLNNGQSYIKHIGTDRVASAHQTGRLLATDDFTRVREADALILCVPTPLGTHHEPDLSFVINTINSLTPHLRRGQLLSLESTTYPGTTEEEIRPRLESKGLTIGEDIFLVYSPEREDPGNKNFTTHNIPKIVGGSTSSCLELGVTLYSQVVEKVVPVSSTQAAEMTKLLENIYRAVNIGLVNELKTVTDRMGINIWEVIDAAATKPFGFTPFYPGPGLGGHCIPIDPFYLTWKAREYGVHTRFIELAGEVNTAMPEWVVNKVMDALNERGKAVKGSKILILGIAYKKNVDDSRESPAVELMELLQAKGAIISYSDPHVPVFPKKRRYHFELESVEIKADILSQMDCVILATEHDAFNYELILENSDLVVDTRGFYREDHENLVKA
ncbi:nucleotide sugar dehydrogenase [Moorena sp. SIO4G3]|uniref:nucleotide sugar dehydrogenase n=1 Tax=Moorena sp. SIO4G3 TaxID=2607821 RepID=UPI00142C5F12|nr:nucleotide sugar dehydrogenase [Moorena sp. SIO4G3]NEO79669.1 nucleotide sugar dehydrogenase [Moorena sp. SIO4G3]